ncbi:hypothetical protein AB4Y72_16100 [Arthrobacter sp. YAF34]|uniref:hypothetical protein n=1 Tax=Arthrobacter sp. YAF34 TaxID=3233083 RepID=UPI003F8E6AEF
MGDSHLGHVVPAWKERGAGNDWLKAGFHIERTYGELPLRIVDGERELARFDDIRCAYSPEVDVNVYDAFVVFGMHFSFTALAKTYEKFRSDEHERGEGSYLLSPAAHAAMRQDLYAGSKAMRVIDALRLKTSKQVYYVQQPLPLEWVLDRTEDHLRFFRDLAGSRDLSVFVAHYYDQLAQLQAGGVRVLAQPVATLGRPGFTQGRFGFADTADLSPDSPYSKGDYFHMNAEYGGLVVEQLLELSTAVNDGDLNETA